LEILDSPVRIAAYQECPSHASGGSARGRTGVPLPSFRGGTIAWNTREPVEFRYPKRPEGLSVASRTCLRTSSKTESSWIVRKAS